MTTESRAQKWDRLNHDWAGGADPDGYAICANCSVTENSHDAADVCWNGPAIMKIRKHVREELGEMKKEAPAWMREIFDAD